MSGRKESFGFFALAALLAGMLFGHYVPPPVKTAVASPPRVVVRYHPLGRFAAAAQAIRSEFGPGPAAACMVGVAGRETGYTYSPRAVNWHDQHSDGSFGSFGLFQIGSDHRAGGESVPHFARRMYVLRSNVAEAHALFQARGLEPWGGSC